MGGSLGYKSGHDDLRVDGGGRVADEGTTDGTTDRTVVAGGTPRLG